MPIKIYKPYTPSRRFITTEDFSGLTKKEPEKSLLISFKKHGGRNNQGHLTTRHQGGGHKRLYRIVDFKRDKAGIAAKVAAIEYDPYRTARLALLHYIDGEKRYIICPLGVKVGDVLVSGPQADIRPGNALPMTNIPEGTLIHNLEMIPGAGAKLVRSAGAWAQLLAKENGFANLKMPSGETRLIPLGCMATVGQVGNIEHENVTLGNAGRSRHLGIRPTVRGTAMNAVDHPHGGGRGKSKGNNQPRSPWNQPAKGFKTRKRKYSDRYILKRCNQVTA
ncbi:MAG: 50S ribosomal protein L2 [Elusimicrobiota bacterium]